MNKQYSNVAEDKIRERKVGLHKDLCSYLSETYRRKNEDYGDSFALLRDEYPEAILVRIGDKYNRLKTLHNHKESMVIDESIADTLMDMANYCIMELIEMRLDADRIVNGDEVMK